MKMKIPDNDKIHLTTINKHLDHLSSFMSWCVNNGYSDMNPFAGVKIKQKKSPRDERDRFSEKELKQIFSKNNYCTNKKPKILTRIGKRGKKRYYFRINTYTYGTFN